MIRSRPLHHAGDWVNSMLLLVGVLSCVPCVANDPRPTNLAAAVDSALALHERVNVSSSDSRSSLDPGDDARWLAAPPMVSASYLASDQAWGTDEAEVSISLPLQSPEHRRRNALLRELDPQLSKVAGDFRRWQLSGWLRDLYARRQRADMAATLAGREVEALARLVAQAGAQRRAGSLPPYDLWVIRQELRMARTRLARAQAEVRNLDRSYASLTGLSQWPLKSGEPSMLPAAPHYAEHPQVRLMDAVQEQGLAALRAGSASLTPWNLGLVGREFSMADRVERQYGLAVSIPIGIGEASESVAVRSSERALRQQYHLELDAWRADLRLRWAELSARREALRAERELLLQDDAVRELRRQLETLQISAEIPIENRVQRRLALLRAEQRPDELALEIAAAEAQMRQLAGESL